MSHTFGSRMYTCSVPVNLEVESTNPATTNTAVACHHSTPTTEPECTTHCVGVCTPMAAQVVVGSAALHNASGLATPWQKQAAVGAAERCYERSYFLYIHFYCTVFGRAVRSS